MIVKNLNSNNEKLETEATVCIRKLLSIGETHPEPFPDRLPSAPLTDPAAERNPPIQQIIDAGVLPKLISYLAPRYKSYGSLQVGVGVLLLCSVSVLTVLLHCAVRGCLGRHKRGFGLQQTHAGCGDSRSASKAHPVAELSQPRHPRAGTQLCFVSPLPSPPLLLSSRVSCSLLFTRCKLRPCGLSPTLLESPPSTVTMYFGLELSPLSSVSSHSVLA